VNVATTRSYHALSDYDAGFEEVEEPEEPDYDEMDGAPDGAEAEGGTADPDAQRPEGGNNVVVAGDPNAAAAARNKNTVAGLKQKRIPDDKRTTTPYMTKYERARVLGTRALQIRLVHS